MRKETILVICFLVLVLTTTAIIWSFAVPVLKPVHIPIIATAMIEEGPDQKQQDLTQDQITGLNNWLRQNRRGWVPMTSPPSSASDLVMQAVPVRGEPFLIKIWGENAGPEWARTIAVRLSTKVSFRVRYCDDQQWTSLREVLARFDNRQMNAH
ncbi:hypothetical protein CGLAMM_00830 [Acetobacteraceae bacterium EV16G]|uniref:Uncharacterized protein n=1 Tax=Sorlinia euscelidii TaxID=3081148 RepID=A0ABU7U303_9PROT